MTTSSRDHRCSVWELGDAVCTINCFFHIITAEDSNIWHYAEMLSPKFIASLTELNHNFLHIQLSIIKVTSIS
jgi:hypothetical protein